MDGNFRRAAPALVDELLIDIAVRIQLSPSMHDVAVERYGAISRWLEREGSGLRGKVRRLYAQGSMAIGSTIRSKDKDDLFDIDLIAEIDWDAGVTPAQMLQKLFDAIRGEKGSRYHDVTKLQTRCVTVTYADMHLDITPMRRNPAWQERGGYIAHAKVSEPVATHKLVPANPWGFAEWFKLMTPAQDWFARLIVAKSYGRPIRADSEPLAEHEALYAKAMAVVALQLMKRHVCMVYDQRSANTRRPPSVYLSESIARNANATASLIDELIYQTAQLQAPLAAATATGGLIDVRNPALRVDKLTDRWPDDLVAQRMFIDDLVGFQAALFAAKKETDIEKLAAILSRLFGERATSDAIGDYYARAGAETRSGASRFQPARNAALSGISMARAPETKSASIPSHRFYGE